MHVHCTLTHLHLLHAVYSCLAATMHVTYPISGPVSGCASVLMGLAIRLHMRISAAAFTWMLLHMAAAPLWQNGDRDINNGRSKPTQSMTCLQHTQLAADSAACGWQQQCRGGWQAITLLDQPP